MVRPEDPQHVERHTPLVERHQDRVGRLSERGYDGAALVSDSADDTATKSATRHTISATIDKADIPDGAKQMTLVLTPATHGTESRTAQRNGQI